MTEASHQMTANPLPAHGPHKPGTVGRAAGACGWASSTGATPSSRRRGWWARSHPGPNVTAGYRHNPAANRRPSRRLVPHGRPGLLGCGRLPDADGPHEGTDQPGRRKDFAAGGGRRPDGPPGRRGGGLLWRARESGEVVAAAVVLVPGADPAGAADSIRAAAAAASRPSRSPPPFSSRTPSPRPRRARCSAASWPNTFARAAAAVRWRGWWGSRCAVEAVRRGGERGEVVGGFFFLLRAPFSPTPRPRVPRAPAPAHPVTSPPGYRVCATVFLLCARYPLLSLTRPILVSPPPPPIKKQCLPPRRRPRARPRWPPPRCARPCRPPPPPPTPPTGTPWSPLPWPPWACASCWGGGHPRHRAGVGRPGGGHTLPRLPQRAGGRLCGRRGGLPHPHARRPADGVGAGPGARPGGRLPRPGQLLAPAHPQRVRPRGRGRPGRLPGTGPGRGGRPLLQVRGPGGRPSDVAPALAAALKAAVRGRPGAAYVDLPSDVLMGPVPPGALAAAGVLGGGGPDGRGGAMPFSPPPPSPATRSPPRNQPGRPAPTPRRRRRR